MPEDRNPNGLLFAALASALGCALQIWALLRYLQRLPSDTVGIILYAVTIVAMAIGAVGFFIRYRAEREGR